MPFTDGSKETHNKTVMGSNPGACYRQWGGQGRVPVLACAFSSARALAPGSRRPPAPPLLRRACSVAVACHAQTSASARVPILVPTMDRGGGGGCKEIRKQNNHGFESLLHSAGRVGFESCRVHVHRREALRRARASLLRQRVIKVARAVQTSAASWVRFLLPARDHGRLQRNA